MNLVFFLSASCTLVVVYSTTVDNLFTGVTFQKVNTDNLPTHLPLNTEITGGTKEIELVGAKNIKITDSFCPQLTITDTKYIAITGGKGDLFFDNPATVIVTSGKWNIYIKGHCGHLMIRGGEGKYTSKVPMTL